ncbi:antitoxin [Psychrobacillus glaciei]|uniref:Antitoxin n=1 Tax=Psychrobacillus glaciei TaxID=2283160 RepID=A0A5J6SJH9_9BACI|nr:antitoxin [Psychrobacillus glaciei]QFF97573.1 antitoxin [Psychrobacillus glaciei]
MSNKKRGRPAGKIKTSKIEITVEPKLKEEFMAIVHGNNQYCSILIREWIIDYIDRNKKRD